MDKRIDSGEPIAGQPRPTARERRRAARARLRVVEAPEHTPGARVPGTRTIGQLIAHTALLADSARGRAAFKGDAETRKRGPFGWFL